MTRRPDDEAHAAVDENELALREIGEDDLDDDPVLPAREPVAAGVGAAPAAGDAAPERRPRRPRRAAPELPTSALVHTPTAAQADGGDHLTPAARAQIERNSRSSPRRTMGIVAMIALVAASVFGVRALGVEEQPDMPPVAGEQDDPSSGDPAAGEPAPADPQAVEELEAKLENDPTNTGTMNSLADLHLASGDYASAQAVRERMVELDPRDVDSLMMLGITAFNAGDGRTAEESWKAAIEVQPDNPEAYYNLGFVYMASDRAEDARAAWEKVGELAPDSSIAATVQQHLDMLESQSEGQ